MLDLTFGSLSDPTRRDILRRISEKELSVGEIAEPYDLSFAAVSKHLMVLEHADLVTKRREGRQHIVQLKPEPLIPASMYLAFYAKFWEDRLDSLDRYLQSIQ